MLEKFASVAQYKMKYRTHYKYCKRFVVYHFIYSQITSLHNCKIEQVGIGS